MDLVRWMERINKSIEGFNTAFRDIGPIIDTNSNSLVDLKTRVGTLEGSMNRNLDIVHRAIERAKVASEDLGPRIDRALAAIPLDTSVQADERALAREEQRKQREALEHISQQFETLPREEPSETPKQVHVVVRVLTDAAWRHRRKVITGIGAVATGAWTYAAPSIWAAIKLFWHGL